MNRNHNRNYSLSLIYSDFLVLILVFLLAYYFRVQLDPRPLVTNVYTTDYIRSFLLIVPFWGLIFASLGLYNSSIFYHRSGEYVRLVFGAMLGILMIIGWEYVTQNNIFPARLVTVYALVGSWIALILSRETIRQIRKYNLRHFRHNERVLLIGNTTTATDFISHIIAHPDNGYKVAAFVGPKRLLPTSYAGKHYKNIVSALNNIDNDFIDTIIQTNMDEVDDKNLGILAFAQINHLKYKFLPGNPDFYGGKNEVEIFMGYPMINVYQTPLIGWGEVAKRLFDLFLVFITLPLWGSIVLVAALLQKLFNPGPILYVSKRLSQFSKPFDLYKFRSMNSKYGSKDASDDFKDMNRPDLVREYRLNHKVKNDPRITTFGKFLRKTSIDELPQLFNVIKGDLSLVGPRPILPQEEKFSSKRSALLHSVKSGVTGLWQVSGRNDLSFEDRIDLETYYAQNWSFWMDIKIIFKTIRAILGGKGAQ